MMSLYLAILYTKGHDRLDLYTSRVFLSQAVSFKALTQIIYTPNGPNVTGLITSPLISCKTTGKFRNTTGPA